MLSVSDTGKRRDVVEALGPDFRHRSILHWYHHFDHSDRSDHRFCTFPIYIHIYIYVCVYPYIFYSLILLNFVSTRSKRTTQYWWKMHTTFSRCTGFPVEHRCSERRRLPHYKWLRWLRECLRPCHSVSSRIPMSGW